jgi:hypothetical protein
MKVLKWFGITILSMMLFISLSVFGLAFTVKSTALNSSFLNREIEQLPISAMARYYTQDIQNSLSPESQDYTAEIIIAINKTIVDIEPELKANLESASTSVYDYFMGKKADPELAITLRNTVLGDAFINKLIDNLPVATIASNVILDQLKTMDIPVESRPLLDYVKPAFVKTEPAIKAELKTATPLIVDYLMGKTQSFNATINLQPIIDNLTTSARDIVVKSLPPEIAKLPQAQIDSYIDQYIDQNYNEIFNVLPTTFSLNQTFIGTDIPAQIADALSQAEEPLATARTYIAMFQRYYIWLIVFCLVLIAGIIAIHHAVRGATRTIGAIFLSYGALEYAGILIGKYFLRVNLFPELETQMAGNTPTELIAYTKQFILNIISPLEKLSLGILIAGVILLVISFVYRHRQTSSNVPENQARA